MFKLAGILLLMAGCCGLGANRVAEAKQRIRELREIRRMVIRIQSEMAYGKRTLPEICLLLGQCMEEPYRTAFSAIYQKMEENDGTGLNRIWKERMEDCMAALPIWEEEKDILRNMPECFGSLDEKQQAADIGQSLDFLTAHIAQAEAGYENQARVTMSISVMTGIFLVILLL
ncbi:MAG: stage III sporulation protein AB [Blautia sp.]|nr:stage III sporulation protein AB [Blautia sp.]MCM1201515.1 stage III sporulation protein AB [Bacteroides fragilis]